MRAPKRAPPILREGRAAPSTRARGPVYAHLRPRSGWTTKHPARGETKLDVRRGRSESFNLINLHPTEKAGYGETTTISRLLFGCVDAKPCSRPNGDKSQFRYLPVLTSRIIITTGTTTQTRSLFKNIASGRRHTRVPWLISATRAAGRTCTPVGRIAFHARAYIESRESNSVHVRRLQPAAGECATRAGFNNAKVQQRFEPHMIFARKIRFERIPELKQRSQF
ncbi:hypothetical protein EVAR_86783_1 [Eumeta japonica]|uniref:Uncharacterized protein n=1 Tax=Eumeta variegata TaxID=151549 RepID=A0A4C1W247_EUMVA|nr:hypothetical protein EVAR_86783_1 [Eumeta japonica]